jgi:hypothetical protein
MIKLTQEGQYKLIETKGQTKILILDEDKTFAWINAADIGEILVTSHKSHITDNILAIGRFRIYSVKKESDLTDLYHIELHVGNGTWQGYLLPTGLPNDKKKRNRIIPTEEIITKSIL